MKLTGRKVIRRCWGASTKIWLLLVFAGLFAAYSAAVSFARTARAAAALNKPYARTNASSQEESGSRKTTNQKLPQEPFEVRKLTQSLGLQSVGPVSPDRKYILLIGKKPDGGPNLYAMDLSGQFRVHPPLTKMKWGVSDPRWSPKGDKIAFAGSDETADFPELYVLNMSNSEIVRLTTNRFSDTEPVFTQDGQTILYATDESPLPDAAFGVLHVASIPVGGGKPRYFTSDDVSTGQPGISGGGESVYLVKIDEESGRHSLWEYKLNGEPLRNITGATFARIHQYAFDPVIGAFAVWAQESVDEQDDLFLVDLKSGEAKRFPEADLPKLRPSISPNGKLIAFMGASAQGSQIFVYNVDTREIRQISYLGAHGYSPAFISDSQIIFGSDRDQAQEAYIVDLAAPVKTDEKKK